MSTLAVILFHLLKALLGGEFKFNVVEIAPPSGRNLTVETVFTARNFMNAYIYKAD